MRLDYVNYEILDALLQGVRTPIIAPFIMDSPAFTTDEDVDLYIATVSGTVFYVLEYEEIKFNMGHCRNQPTAFEEVTKDKNICLADNILEPTADIRVVGPDPKRNICDFLLGDTGNTRMLTRFKGARWDTFVDINLLEAFDEAKYYQSSPTGPIAVIEDGCLVGFVAPINPSKELVNHYTDSPAKREEK